MTDFYQIRFIEIISAIILLITAFVIYKQLKAISDQTTKTLEWNRQKATADIIHCLLSDEYFEWHKSLRDYNCRYTDGDQTYDNLKDSKDIEEIDKLLQQFCNIFEEVSMQINHGVFDDDISYDFLGYIITEFYRWSKPYIKKVADKHHQKIFINFKTLGNKWRVRRKKEEQQYKDKIAKARDEAYKTKSKKIT